MSAHPSDGHGRSPELRVGVHLPLMDFGGNPYTIDHLVDYASTAARLGFHGLAANDHLTFSTPWLDGPTALAAVLGSVPGLELMTTVALPAVRGPIATAKTLGAIHRLSGGRLVAGIGPGSSPEDYGCVGLDFDERWVRLEEAARVLRALWRRGSDPFVGHHYSTEGVHLEPYPDDERGPAIWIGSWGSAAGLARVARIADGWLASAYNTTPTRFGESWDRLRALLTAQGRDPDCFPNGLATMWCYVTDDEREAEEMTQRLLRAVHRPEEVLRDRIPIGPPAVLEAKLRAFARNGLQQVHLWPLANEVSQLERIAAAVIPSLAADALATQS